MPTQDDADRVGYKHPPKAYQFQPGISGNPSGRPKATLSFKSELCDELSEPMPFGVGAEKRIITKARAVVKTLVASAIAGDARAIATILSVAIRAFPEKEATDEIEAPEDREIIQAVASRPAKRRSKTAARTETSNSKE